MQCPKCHHISLKPATTSDKLLKLDICPQCKGVWFDARKLSQSLGRNASEQQVPPHAFKAKNTTCPRCKVHLFEYGYPQTEVLVDGCKQCHGVWLDDTEFRHIKHTLSQHKEIMCPRCHAKQSSDSTCTQCGVIFARWRERQQVAQIQTQEQHHRTQAMFQNASAYSIHQQRQWLEVLTLFERKNRYQVVMQSDRNHVGCVHEHSTSFFNFFGRQFMGSWRPATLRLEDDNTHCILIMKKRFRFFLHHIDIYDADDRFLGSATRTLHLLFANYDIHDANGTPLMRIKGPLLLPFKDAVFKVFKKEEEIGHINKKWKGIWREYYHSGDSFHVNFHRHLSMREKILLFGAVFLIDFVSFERH